MNSLRSLKRTVSHKRMKKNGYIHVNKGHGKRSYFAKHWREFI